MEAYLYEKLEDNRVQCKLCHHRCVIKPQARGRCSVRENQSGTLSTLVYGKLVARHIDPIEKKPLFHFMPGTRSYSIATVGCNFRCLFCQNADIAQLPTDRHGMIIGEAFSPEDTVSAAQAGGCQSISYTYTEPTVYFEYAFDTAKLAHEKGLKNVFVTNGFMTPEALEMISPYLDAANVDLKAFSDRYYREICGGRLEPVKQTLALMKSMGIFVEITTLIVPGLNDDSEELGRLVRFIADELGCDTPWHVSRFYPTYRMTDRPPTPVQTLEKARDIGLKGGLRYVYTGNVPGDEGENTFCYNCKKLLIDRWGFTIRKNMIDKGRCPYCGVVIDGVGW